MLTLMRTELLIYNYYHAMLFNSKVFDLVCVGANGISAALDK